MGLLGLRKFIDSTGCTQLLHVPLSEEEALEEQTRRQEKRQRFRGDVSDDYDAEENDEGLSSSTATPCCDHVLVDMNCIVHSCFGKQDVVNKTRKELMQTILERLGGLLTKVVIPRKTLSICLDGPAPFAKLQTQRLRRRKVAHMDASAQQMTSLAITAGSLFMVELENALAAQFKLNNGKGFLRKMCPVYLFGSTMAGEGEAKISRALTFLATAGRLSKGSADATSSAASIYDRTVATGSGNVVPPYNANDTVTIIGNDIDLVLTCMGATPYHNLMVVGPSSLQLIDVASMMYRWLRASAASGAESAQIAPWQLPSVRVDFVFLFLLNGGDHYTGAGEIALSLWRRYRTVRAAYPNSTLVSPNMTAIDVDFLGDVVDADGYTGEADVQMGVDLLHHALWSLYTTVTGVCPDYTYVPEPSAPHINNLRAAAALYRRHHKEIRLHYVPQSKPLTPLETYVALMPTEATMPRSIVSTLRQPAQMKMAKKLMASNDAKEISLCAQALVTAAASSLTPSEQYLQHFTQPVQLNVLPKKRRLSRYMQHKMLATTGAVTVESPIPYVAKIELPEELPFAQWEYTEQTRYLSFVNPFSGGVVPPPQNGSSSHGAPLRSTPRRVYLGHDTDTNDAEEAAALKKLADVRGQAEHLTRHQRSGKLREPRRLQAVKRKLHRLEMAGAKRVRDEIKKDDGQHILRRGEDRELLGALEKFLGDDAVHAKALMSSAAVAATGSGKGKRRKEGPHPNGREAAGMQRGSSRNSARKRSDSQHRHAKTLGKRG